MRLATLTLARFRSYVDVTVPMDARRILVTGENGVGKSTLREAIRWLLTGRCSVTDGRGIGSDLLAPHGTTQVDVSATGTPFETMHRAKAVGQSQEFVIKAMRGEASLQQQALYIALETTPALLDAVLETEHFLRLHHAEAKALVLSLLNVTVPVGAEMLTLDQLDARYERAFKERKEAKIRQRAHTVPAAPTPALPNVDPLEAPARVEDQLRAVRDELAALERQVGVSIGRRQTLEQALAALQTPRASHRDPVAIVADLEALDPVTVIEADPTVAERLKVLTQQQAALKAHDPKRGCVLDPAIDCPQAKRKFTVRARELGIEIEALPPLPATVPPPRDVERMRALLQQELAQADAAIDAAAHAATEAEALRAQIAALAEPDAAAVSALDVLKARIAKGEMLLRQTQTVREAALRRQEALQQQTALDAEVQRLEQACADYGPNGLRVAALAEAIGSFTTAVNAHLTRWGWTIAFDLDPWGVTVNGRPVETYSESEQFRVGIGLQLAIAAISGLSFAIVDRLDMLDLKNRALATQMVLESPVDQVLLLATREPEMKLPTLAGVIAHRIGKSGSSSVILESTGGAA